MVGCANDKVVNAKLLKLKKNFFMTIALIKRLNNFNLKIQSIGCHL